MDLPRNSNHGTPQEPKKIEGVTVNKVTRRQKPMGRRFFETFVSGDDAKGVFDYIVFDVMIPAIKDLVSDAGSQLLDRFLFGESRAPHRRASTRPSGNSGYISYNRFSTSPRQDDRPPLPRRTSNDFDDLVFQTRAEALEVLDQMNDVIEKYGVVTQADVYEMAELSPQPIDHKWGWSDLTGARVMKVRDGHMIQIPRKPEPIN